MLIPAPRTGSIGSRASYDAIVIGSGIGGAACAAILARHKKRVLVLEKNDRLGGILASYHREGFKLDLGSHLFARGKKGPIGRALRLSGAKGPHFLTHPIPIRTRGIYETALPKSRWDLPFVAKQTLLELGLREEELASLERLVWKIFTARKSDIEAWDQLSLHDLILRYTQSPGAYFVLAFLASIFFVLPPWDVAAGEAMLALRRVVRDWSLSYVAGGLDNIPHALLQVVTANDGEILLNNKVVQIEPCPGGLSVGTENGEAYFAPFVVSNAAPQEVPDLLFEGDAPQSWIDRLRAIRPSGNAWQLKLALKRPLVPEGCAIGGVSLEGLRPEDLSINMMRSVVADLARGKITDPTPIYAPVPTNFDPTLAPNGGQLIVASIYGCYGPSAVDSNQAWERHCLKVMSRAIPHLADELLFHEFIPIKSIGTWMSRESAGAISNGQYPDQVGKHRLPVRTPIKGLYLAGDGAGGRGIGTELAAASGIEVAHEILEASP